MPPKIKSEAEKLKARLYILDAARELFVSKGVESVTMREIAKKIKYSPTTIYLHFKDKESLIHEMCLRDYQKLGEELGSIMQIKGPVERMQAMGTAYAKFALTYPNHYRMIFMTVRPNEDCEAEIEPSKDAYKMLQLVVQDVYDNGHFLPEITDPELIAQTIWAGVHGVCSLEINMGHDPHIPWREVEARLQLMLSTLTRGLIKYTNYKSKLR